MLKKKTFRYLSENCSDMIGKTVIVTGANSGIGFKATEELAAIGASVIMACRSPKRAEAARQELLASNPGAKLTVRELDLASSASIQRFAQSLISDHLDIHALVNNAGVLNVHGTTAEGEELIMGTNYTGTVLLTEALLPYFESLDHEVKVTVTSSISYVLGRDDWEQREMGLFRTYATSKRRLTRYGIELAKSKEETASNVKVYLTHPGMSATAIANKAFGEKFVKVVKPLAALVIQSPEKSALAIPYVLSNDLPTGKLYGPKGPLHGWGYPSLNPLSLD